VTVWLTLAEAEMLVRRDEAEIYSAMRRGHIRAVRLDDWLIDAADLVGWASSTPSVQIWT
jgi:hypothetical protein